MTHALSSAPGDQSCEGISKSAQNRRGREQASSPSFRLQLLFLLVTAHASVWGHVEGTDTSRSSSSSRHAWEAAGCHLVGHTRTVRIPECVAFDVTTNACRGYCLSYAIPSPSYTLAFNFNFIITSRAECCGIVDTHDVKVSVLCRGGYREITFKSARSCACSICRSKQ